MEIKGKFPESRLIDPKRQAELAVYRDLQASTFPGVALYSVRLGPNSPELDFPIWMQGIARFNAEVKGGPYFIRDTEWFLGGPGGATPKTNPLLQAWDGAMFLRGFIGERLGQRHCPFIIPVVVFPDMEPDPSIEALTTGGQGHVIFGSDDVAGRLAAIAAEVHVKYPPTDEDIQRETALLLSKTAGPAAASPSAVEGDGGALNAREVIIHHVDTVNLYTSKTI